MSDSLNQLFEKRQFLDLSKQNCFELLLIIKHICETNSLSYWLDGGTLLGSQRHKGFIPWDDDIDICFPYSDYKKLIPLLKDFCSKNNRYILFHESSELDFIFDFFGDTSYLIDNIFPIRIDLIPIKTIPNLPESIRLDRSLTSIYSIYYQGKSKCENEIIAEHHSLLPEKDNDFIKKQNDFIKIYRSYIEENEIKCSNISPEKCLITYCFADMSVQKSRPYFEYSDIYPLSKVEFENFEFSSPSNVEKYLTILYGEKYLLPPPISHQKKHFNTIIKNKLTVQQTRYLLNLFYYFGVLNFGYKKSKLSKIHTKINNSFRFIFTLLLKGKYKELSYLLKYINLKIRKKR